MDASNTDPVEALLLDAGPALDDPFHPEKAPVPVRSGAPFGLARAPSRPAELSTSVLDAGFRLLDEFETWIQLACSELHRTRGEYWGHYVAELVRADLAERCLDTLGRIDGSSGVLGLSPDALELVRSLAAESNSLRQSRPELLSRLQRLLDLVGSETNAIMRLRRDLDKARGGSLGGAASKWLSGVWPWASELHRNLAAVPGLDLIFESYPWLGPRLGDLPLFLIALAGEDLHERAEAKRHRHRLAGLGGDSFDLDLRSDSSALRATGLGVALVHDASAYTPPDKEDKLLAIRHSVGSRGAVVPPLTPPSPRHQEIADVLKVQSFEVLVFVPDQRQPDLAELPPASRNGYGFVAVGSSSREILRSTLARLGIEPLFAEILASSSRSSGHD